jgi:Ca-activated chloride channel family protein
LKSRALRAGLIGLTLTGLVLPGCKRPAGGQGLPPAKPANLLEVVFTYGSEKEEWIKEVTKAFNAQKPTTKSGKVIRVTATPNGSGECVDELLKGRVEAHLCSPASGVYVTLGDAWSRKAGKGELLKPVGVKPGERMLRLVRSPVVIAVWRPMAEAMGWPKRELGWKDVQDLVTAPAGWGKYGQEDWGRFRFAHTHPLFSNSGLISVLAEVYAAAGKTGGLTLDDVKKAGGYLERLEKGVVHYGSSTGFLGKRMYANPPTFLNAAVLYENMVVESYLPANKGKVKGEVVAIYPKEGTFWSDHPVGLVNRGWVTEEHREAAEKYVAFLMAAEQQKRAMAFGFRPGVEKIDLAAPLDRKHGIDPDNEPRTILEVPPAEVMEAILGLWKAHKKRSRVVLVIDVSGSMNDDRKLDNAKEGALALLDLLGERDTLSLMVFNSKVYWKDKRVVLDKAGKARLAKSIRNLTARDQTALYDAVAEASAHLDGEPDPDKISALVVLTDGKDNRSKLKLEDLKKKIAFDSEKRPTRIFTICYGSSVERPTAEEGELRTILEGIAEATKAKGYLGDPKNIRKVFVDIFTFFGG